MSEVAPAADAPAAAPPPDEWKGGVLLYCGGTNYSAIGKASVKKSSLPQEEQDRLTAREALYPNLPNPHRIASLVDIPIRFVSAGCCSSHALAVSMAGEAYTWGRGALGQLGHDSLFNHNVPTLVKGLVGKVVTAGACGKGHTVVITSEGDSFAFGCNTHGQLGVGSIQKKGPEDLRLTPVQCSLSDVKTVSCGAEFSIWITAAGGLLSAGLPQYGQLGDGTDHEYNAADSSIKIMYEPQPAPVAVAALAEKNIVALSCGQNHCVAADDAGCCYTWGNGGYGRLGHEVQRDEHAPRKVDALSGRFEVCKDPVVCASGTASFCEASEARYMMFWGKLKASGDSQMKASYLDDLVGWNVRSMSASQSTFAVAADDSLITWGQALAGELGYGPTGKKSSANPCKVASLTGVVCQQVACGVGLTLILAKPGSAIVDALPVWEPESPVDDDDKATRVVQEGIDRAAAKKRKAAAPRAPRAKR